MPIWTFLVSLLLLLTAGVVGVVYYIKTRKPTKPKNSTWTCYHPDTKKTEGTIQVAWGYGPGGVTREEDAAWACNQWIPACGNASTPCAAN